MSEFTDNQVFKNFCLLHWNRLTVNTVIIISMPCFDGLPGEISEIKNWKNMKKKEVAITLLITHIEQYLKEEKN